MDTIDYWKGEGGDAYTKRNRVDWQSRIPFWKMILDKTGARSVLEVGCNAGWNLSAIKRIYPDIGLIGHEINEEAVYQGEMAGLKVNMCLHERFELVFTAGFLIHIHPEDLKQSMQELVGSSLDYILAIEYYADEETEIEYRGEMGLLWKRPYGLLYQEMGLKLIDFGDNAQGFDNCSWTLLRK